MRNISCVLFYSSHLKSWVNNFVKLLITMGQPSTPSRPLGWDEVKTSSLSEREGSGEEGVRANVSRMSEDAPELN